MTNKCFADGKPGLATSICSFCYSEGTFHAINTEGPGFAPDPVLTGEFLALSGDSNWLYVADILGVIQVDLRDNASRNVDPGKHSTLAGIDGLYWYQGSLVGVQYGNGPYRVARWRLSRDGKNVRSTEIFGYRTPLISFPMTAAIIGENFYFIANTGIANYKDGKVVDPAKLEPIHIAVVSLQ